MNKIKVMTVFGTRPEAIKMAPLVHALEQNENTESIVCVTAQHREMLDQVLDIFGIKPDYDLNIMQPRQTLATITEKSLHGLDEVLEKAQPDIVLVHGDTSTTFAGALAAFYHKIPVGHVEAGLRTYDKYSPFPEEMNRKLTGQIATLHFAPTPRNRDNLAREGITEGVSVVGNTVVDAIHMTVKPDFAFRDEQLKKLDFENNRVVLVTAHRRENYGEPMENICRAIAELSEAYPDVHFVYPVHLSPYVRETAEKFLGGNDRIHLIHPLTVDEMHNLMARCFMIMTDSGGLQEEAPSLGKPVLVLRRETERPEAIEAGTVKLAGVEQADIVKLARELFEDETAYARMAHAVNPYGDGKTSQRIVEAIEHYFGLREDGPAPFNPTGEADTPVITADSQLLTAQSVADVDITTDNVQHVIASLTRPEAYSCTIENKLYYTGGSSSLRCRRYVRDGVIRTDTLTESGAVRASIIRRGDTIYSWNADSSAVYEGRAGSFSDDASAMLPTYEDVLAAGVTPLSAGRTSTDSEPCIIVSFDLDGYRCAYSVSASSGLLKSASFYSGDTLTRSVSVSGLSTEAPDKVYFTLPGGKTLLGE